MNEETINVIKQMRDNELTWQQIGEKVGYQAKWCLDNLYKYYPDMKRKRYDKKLTSRELMIFKRMVIDGVVNRIDLASELGIAVGTMATHLDNIFFKLQVHTLSELIWRYYNGKIERELINEI